MGREIKRYHIHCDIKLKILAAVKWKRMPGQARTVRLQPLAPALLKISISRICITFAYELKRSLQSLLFDV